jgi:hypothetical protein
MVGLERIARFSYRRVPESNRMAEERVTCCDRIVANILSVGAGFTVLGVAVVAVLQLADASVITCSGG